MVTCTVNEFYNNGYKLVVKIKNNIYYITFII